MSTPGLPCRLPRWAVLVLAATALASGCGGGSGEGAARLAGEGKIALPATSTRRAPLPAPPRTEVVGASWNGRIVVLGGLLADGSPTTQVDIYDPRTDTWSAGPPMPTALHHAGAGVMDDRVYVVGGYTGAGWTPVAAVHSLGPGETQWRAEPPMAGPRGALAVASTGNGLVAAGGVGSGDLVRTEILERGATSWRPGPDLGTRREHLAAAVAGGRAYAIGGRDGQIDTNRDSVESLALGEGRWRAEPKLNHARGGTGGASPHGLACVAGGEEPAGTIRPVECLVGVVWKVVAELEVPRHGVAVVADGNRLHVIGGGPQPGLFVSDVHEVFEL
jgi:hypothetical protein